MLNSRVTGPARRRLEQPSAEKAKRSGCLVWGAVLGVLVGIMVGIYALPPILKHYYGEEVIAPNETYQNAGKSLRIKAVVPMASDRQPGTGMRVEAFEVLVVGLSDTVWQLDRALFTLEVRELDDWQPAVGLNGQGGLAELTFAPGIEYEYGIRFEIEYAGAEGDSLTPEALHLSDPRVKFEVAR